MKKLLVLLSVLVAQASWAIACNGEAQLIAKIKGIAVEDGVLKAYIDRSEVSFHAANQLCPLHIEEIAELGVIVKSRDLKEINGVVVKDGAGDLVLE